MVGEKGKGGLQSQMKNQRDTIGGVPKGVPKGDFRRLARRGGVKQIAATIYDDVRQALDCLRSTLKDAIAVVERTNSKNMSVSTVF